MKLPITDLGAIGWIPDVDGFELPPNAWTDVNNVRFRNGYVECMKGHVEVYCATRAVTTFAVQWLQQYSASATTKYMIQVGTTAAYAVAADGSATDITGSALTSADGDKVTGGVQFGVLGVNNTVDVPQFWAGNLANNLATFTGWNTNWRAKALRPFRGFWIAMNITKSGTAYPHQVKWSAAADPGAPPASWDETDVTNDAGENNLDGQDVVVDGLKVGDQFWVFKERSIHAMSFIGAPLIWRFQALPGENGMLAASAQTIQVRYWKALDIASDATNWVLTNAADVYLFGALLFAGGFLREDERLTTWKAILDEGIDELNTSQARSGGNAATLVTEIAAVGGYDINTDR